jgi:hypothetical protein
MMGVHFKRARGGPGAAILSGSGRPSEGNLGETARCQSKRLTCPLPLISCNVRGSRRSQQA